MGQTPGGWGGALILNARGAEAALGSETAEHQFCLPPDRHFQYSWWDRRDLDHLQHSAAEHFIFYLMHALHTSAGGSGVIFWPGRSSNEGSGYCKIRGVF